MSGWFANVSDRRRIEIPEIDGWIECRKELTVGEKRTMFSRAFKGQVTLENGDVRNEYDTREISFAKVCAYLVDWSDKSEVSPDAIKALRTDIYDAIESAVDKHIEETEKNAPAAVTKKAKRNAAQTSSSAAE
jgi:hypothetical protein